MSDRTDKIIIEWQRDGVRVLSLHGDGAGASVRGQGERMQRDHLDPAVPVKEAGESLRAWLDSLGVGRGRTTVVLPREGVVLRRLQTPHAPADELADLVRFQAATKTSANIDSLALDFLAIPQPDPNQPLQVVTITVDRDQLTRMTQVLAAAGLELEHVTLSPLTVARLVRASGVRDLGVNQPELLVHQHGPALELSIFDAGTLVFSHSLRLAEGVDEVERLKPLKSELTRSLIALNQLHPNAGIERCYYVAGEIDSGVFDLLQTRFPQGFVRVGATVSPTVPGFEALLGAVLETQHEPYRIDLLHPRRRVEKADRRPWYWGAAAVGVAALLLIGYGMFLSQKNGLQASIRGLQDQAATIDQQLQAGKPRFDAYAKIARWEESHSDPIALWNTLREKMPSTGQVYLVDLHVIPQSGEAVVKYTGKGRARTRTDVELLNQTFRQSGFRVIPKTPQNRGADPDYPFEFDFDFELLRDQPPAST